MKRFLAVLLIVGLIVALGGCGGKKAEDKQAGDSKSKEPIKIGWVGALSGTNAILGKWDTHGIELAFDELNAKGGINGRPLKLIKYDDEGDPTKAVNVAQKLTTEDKVVAAFATPMSTPTLAVVPVFQKAKIPHITGALSADITKKGSAFVFRNTAAGPAYEVPLIEYLVKKGFKKYAIITDTGAYGKGEADYQQAALKSRGIESLTRENYNPEDKDFSGQLNNIIKLNPEVLLFGGSEVASGLIAKQARQLGFKGQLAGGAAIGTSKYIEVAGAEVANGTIYSNPYITNDLNDKTRDFAKRYKDKWGYEPESHGAKAYDGALMLIIALQKAGANLTGEEVAKQLHAIKDFDGLQGKFSYDDKGEGIAKAQVGVVKDGQLVPVKD